MIGDRIKQRREELGISQDELARRMGYKSRSSINKIEVSGRGLPQDKIKLMAKILNVSIGYLMEDEEDNVRESKTFTSEIGDRIKVLRWSRNMNPDELANKVGISIQRLHDMENGVNRSFDNEVLTKLAIALGVKESYFLNGNHEVNIGKNIEAMRLMSNTSIQDISVGTNTEVSRIIKVENGTPPTVEEIERVAKFFHIPEQWIINFDFTSIMDDERIKLAFQILAMKKEITKEEREQIFSYAKFILTK